MTSFIYLLSNIRYFMTSRDNPCHNFQNANGPFKFIFVFNHIIYDHFTVSLPGIVIIIL